MPVCIHTAFGVLDRSSRGSDLSVNVEAPHIVRNVSVNLRSSSSDFETVPISNMHVQQQSPLSPTFPILRLAATHFIIPHCSFLQKGEQNINVKWEEMKTSVSLPKVVFFCLPFHLHSLLRSRVRTNVANRLGKPSELEWVLLEATLSL